MQGPPVYLPILFLLISAVAINRMVDLFTIRNKLEQLKSKMDSADVRFVTFRMLRWAINKSNNREARHMVTYVRRSMKILDNYFLLLGIISLALFSFVGLCTLASVEVQQGNRGALGLVLAGVTMLISLATSLLNFTMEKAKLYL